MKFSLKGKRVVVTSGSSCIGREVSIALVREGAIPFIVVRNKENVTATISEIEKNGWQASFTFAELTKPEDCKKAVDVAMEKFDRIDGVIVSNHGGRQLDAGESSIKPLTRIAAKYAKDIKVMVDSGLRSGSDIARTTARVLN